MCIGNCITKTSAEGKCTVYGTPCFVLPLLLFTLGQVGYGVAGFIQAMIAKLQIDQMDSDLPILEAINECADKYTAIDLTVLKADLE